MSADAKAPARGPAECQGRKPRSPHFHLISYPFSHNTTDFACLSNRFCGKGAVVDGFPVARASRPWTIMGICLCRTAHGWEFFLADLAACPPVDIVILSRCNILIGAELELPPQKTKKGLWPPWRGRVHRSRKFLKILLTKEWKNGKYAKNAKAVNDGGCV